MLAKTIGGADPDRVQGAGHVGDACPADVHIRVAGLVDVCTTGWLALPQAHMTATARVAVTARQQMRRMPVERCCQQTITKSRL